MSSATPTTVTLGNPFSPTPPGTLLEAGPYVLWTLLGTSAAVVESVYMLINNPVGEIDDAFVIRLVDASGVVVFAQASQAFNLATGPNTLELTWARGAVAVSLDDAFVQTNNMAFGGYTVFMTMPLPDLALVPNSYVTLSRYSTESSFTALDIDQIVVTWTAVEQGATVEDLAGPFMLVPGPGA